ncbi:ImmA/IrrE family metallo-endopeptidase [Mesorhizobium carmichaelinearum]|uniref:ImmA/IrrE family metallo-endopeptidase n=1 Tax=Mesorhizobium carmichaelinearum TaxID=1208188 RepID=UPI000BA4966A|nr:ImmA/IrrE family metallo-endopeptidase [Mesorhizobium carmichaelinearum]
MEKFNHNMMTLARDARGLTQAELADRMGVGQGTLSKYETGFSDPPREFVEDLATSLKFLPSFFFEPGRPYGMPPFHYRRRKKLSSKALARIVAEMNIRRLHISKMLVSFSMRTNAFIPEINPDEYQGKGRTAVTPEEAARVIREMWMLPTGPIPNMMELLEDNGGVVVPCDFGTDLIDAMSQRIDGLPVLFFVNVNAPSDRIRHTLAHELGHMVLHTAQVKSDEEMEDEADEFAGAFLVPASEIRPQLRRFDLRQLANLKLYWKVSMGSLAVRAARLKLITPYQSKMFWIEMGKLGYRKREPNEPPKESPNLLRQMVSFHLKKLGYTTKQLSTLLHLTEPEFNVMYRSDILGEVSSGRPPLRVVK